MAIVLMEFNSKNWCDADTGAERDPTLVEVAEVFQQFSVATNCPIKSGPYESGGFWYCEFTVELSRIKAFMNIFDWTMDFQATLIEAIN